MNTISRSLAILIIGSQLTSSALAATIIPCGTTEPELLLTKFSFNSTADFAEITVMNDGNGGNGTILNSWKLGTIDSTLKTLSNFPIRTGETYILNDIGNLTSTTDQLVLLNEKGEIKDAACWTSTTPTIQEQTDFVKLGSQWDKDITSCMPSTGLAKETAFERTQHQDTNQASDWKKAVSDTSTLIPQAPVVEETAPTAPSELVATNEVVINELLPDPEGSDDNAEWIELKNTSDHEVSLQGWQLDDEEGGSKPYAFTDETIGAESFIVMKNVVTHITLNNTKDSARLIDPAGTITSNYTYPKVETGKSWARMKDRAWVLTDDTTPGEENSLPAQENTQDATPTIGTSINPLPDTSSVSESSIEVSEIFPNPTGTDKGNEWIEIHNSTTAPLDLSGWKILNSAGKTFTFPSGTTLSGQGYLILTDQITKISLNNSGDQVQVLNPDGSIEDTRTFESAPENVSFAKISTVGLEEETIKPARVSQTMSLLSWLADVQTAEAQTLAPPRPEESTWEWTDMITKGAPNPTYHRIKGIVVEEPNENHTFTIEHAGKRTMVQFDPVKTHLDILKATLIQGASIEMTVMEKGTTLILETYRTIGTPDQETSSPLLTTIMISFIILLVSALVFAYIKRKTLFGTENISIHSHDSNPSASGDTPAHKSPQAPLTW